MREIMDMLAIVQDWDSEVIDIAKGKYEYDGKLFSSLKKIIENG